MAVRWLPAALLALAAGAACGQDAAPPVTELPPFLVVPPAPVAPRRPCHACPNEYNPSHVYLPDQNPDWGAGSCDGECRPCRMAWANVDFFCGKTDPLGEVDRRWSYGCRVGGGHWLSADRTVGAEFGLFNLHDSHHVIVAGPTIVNSPITFTTFDANLRVEILSHERFRVDGLAGYRYARLHEELFIGNAAFITDLDAKNHLHAGQVGAVGTYRFGAYFCEVLGKLAVGPNDQVLTANGVRTSENVVSILGEMGGRVGYQLGEGCWGTLGYTLFYMSNAERPRSGDAGWFLHGLTVGIEARF
jgi:hypothetical protein